jgi:hypothetical protein
MWFDAVVLWSQSIWITNGTAPDIYKKSLLQRPIVSTIFLETRGRLASLSHLPIDFIPSSAPFIAAVSNLDLVMFDSNYPHFLCSGGWNCCWNWRRTILWTFPKHAINGPWAIPCATFVVSWDRVIRAVLGPAMRLSLPYAIVLFFYNTWAGLCNVDW